MATRHLFFDCRKDPVIQLFLQALNLFWIFFPLSKTFWNMHQEGKEVDRGHGANNIETVQELRMYLQKALNNGIL